MMPRYPIFIPSKGRSDSRLTMKALDRMKVPYTVVVEPQEVEKYAAVIGREKLLVLPENDRGLPYARNFITDYVKKNLKVKRYWQIDDNIRAFRRLLRNRDTRVNDGACFRVVEDLADRYLNVAIAGMQYMMFVPVKSKWRAFVVNHRVYSCMLILTSLPFRWVEKNEDTDFSLQALKAGWCTLLLNAFNCQKNPTMKMKGGMSDEYLNRNGRWEMAKYLRELHPDVVRVVKKWGRPQHSVDYSSFKKNRLIRDPSVKVPKGVNEYGLKLKEIE